MFFILAFAANTPNAFAIPQIWLFLIFVYLCVCGGVCMNVFIETMNGGVLGNVGGWVGWSFSEGYAPAGSVDF